MNILENNVLMGISKTQCVFSEEQVTAYNNNLFFTISDMALT